MAYSRTVIASPEYGFTTAYSSFYAFNQYPDYPVANCLDKADTNNFARFGINYSDTEKIYLLCFNEFELSDIPNDVLIKRIVIKIKYQISSPKQCNWLGIELADAILAIHGETIALEYGDVSGELKTFTIDSDINDTGTWDISEIKSLQLLLYMSNKPGSGEGTYIDIYGVTVSVTYGYSPTIRIGTPSRTKISSISGYDRSTVTFTSNVDLSSWEARATKVGEATGHGVGLLVEEGDSLDANTEATVNIDDEELTSGDAEYIISIFGLSTDRWWSDE